MADLDLDMIDSGASDTDTTTGTIVTNSVTFESGNIYLCAVHWRVNSGSRDAELIPTKTGVTFANATHAVLFSQKGLSLWTATVTEQQVGPITYTMTGSDEATHHAFMTVEVLNPSTTLEQAIVAASNNSATTQNVAYGSTTEAATLDIAFFSSDSDNKEMTPQTGWSDQDVNPTQMRATSPNTALECHHETGSNTEATTDFDTSGSGFVIALELIAAAGGVTSHTQRSYPRGTNRGIMRGAA